MGVNAERNGLLERVTGLQGDAFDALRQLKEEGERFDLVMLDPPAFIKRRKDEREGLQAYQRLNRLGLEVLEPGGLLVTSSCSFHLGRDEFLRQVQQAPMSACNYWSLAVRDRTIRSIPPSPRRPISRPSSFGHCRAFSRRAFSLPVAAPGPAPRDQDPVNRVWRRYPAPAASA